MISITAELSTEGTDKWGEAGIKKLENIATILHNLFFGRRGDDSNKPEPLTTTDDRSVYGIASADTSPEHRFVHGLAEGKTLANTAARATAEGQTARWESRVAHTFTATNIIRHTRNKEAGC